MMFLFFALMYFQRSLASDVIVRESHTLPIHAKPIDILFVVDNSPTLFEKQKLLSKASPYFLAALKDLNWQMAITNSDMSEGVHSLKGQFIKLNDKGEKILRPENPDKFNLLAENLIQIQAHLCNPECPYNNKEPLAAATNSLLKSQSSNREFFREDAELLIIFITDSDEQITGPLQAIKPGHLMNALESAFPNKILMTAGFILLPNDLSCKQKINPSYEYSLHLDYLMQITQGKSFSVCLENYKESLLEVAQSIPQKLYSIELREIPEESTIEIQSKQKLMWTLDGKKIVFKSKPQWAETIEVSYKPTDKVIMPKK